MENELVFIGENGRPVTNSLKVSELFGKRHHHVLRDIRNLECSKKFHETNFGLCQEIKPLEVGSTKIDYYQMTKDGFTFLVMGYTGAKAAQFKEAYINAFNEMECRLKNAQPDLTLITKNDLTRMLLESEADRNKMYKEVLERDLIISTLKQNPVQTNLDSRMDRLERLLMLTHEANYQVKNKLPTSRVNKRPSISSSKMIRKQFPGAMTMLEMCGQMKEVHNIVVNTKNMIELLHKHGWLITTNKKLNYPSAECINNQWMTFTSSWIISKGLQYHTPYITLKGFDYFAGLITKKQNEL